MPDKNTSKRQAYVAFLEGSAERLHALLKKNALKPDEFSGEFERNLIGALEIISGTPVKFINSDHQIGYQFVHSETNKTNVDAEQSIPPSTAKADLESYPIWKALQKDTSPPGAGGNANNQLPVEYRYRIVLEHLYSGFSPEDLCDREGISTETLSQWTLELLDAGKHALENLSATPISSEAASSHLLQQIEFEVDRLKDALITLLVENKALRKTSQNVQSDEFLNHSSSSN